jgi:hypothetical protein
MITRSKFDAVNVVDVGAVLAVVFTDVDDDASSSTTVRRLCHRFDNDRLRLLPQESREVVYEWTLRVDIEPQLVGLKLILSLTGECKFDSYSFPE